MGQLREKLKTVLFNRKTLRVLLVLGIAAGVAAGVRMYMHKRTLTVEYAVRKLNEAVVAGNTAQLEQLVDFAGLADTLAVAMAAARPEAGNDAYPRYLDAVQHRLHDLFAKDSKGGHAPAAARHGAQADKPGQTSIMDDEVFDILKIPIQIQPPDLLNQLKEHPLVIQLKDEDTAILSTTVQHVQIKQAFELRLGMQRTDQGWKVSGFGNGEQLVSEFLGRIKEMETKALAAFDQENTRQNLLMGMYYYVETCRAVFFPPDASGVARLRITLQGSNRGERDTYASGSSCDMFDRNGVKVATMRLENTRVVKAGETFDHAWFYNFGENERYSEVDALVAAGTVSCVATPTAISLGQGSMLYIRSAKDLPGVRLE